jgi:hypothetical protein
MYCRRGTHSLHFVRMIFILSVFYMFLRPLIKMRLLIFLNQIFLSMVIIKGTSQMMNYVTNVEFSNRRMCFLSFFIRSMGSLYGTNFSHGAYCKDWATQPFHL